MKTSRQQIGSRFVSTIKLIPLSSSRLHFRGLTVIFKFYFSCLLFYNCINRDGVNINHNVIGVTVVYGDELAGDSFLVSGYLRARKKPK